MKGEADLQKHDQARRAPNGTAGATALARFVVRYPRQILWLVLLVTLALGLGLQRGLLLDVTPLVFVERNSQAQFDFQRTRQQFGDDRFLIVAVESTDIFAPADFAKLRELHEQIVRIPGVAEVLSLSDIPYVRSLPDGAQLDKLIPAGTPSPERLSEARAVATQDRLYVGNLVAPDGRTAALNVRLKGDQLSSDEYHQATQAVYEQAQRAGFRATYFAGDPFTRWRTVGAIQRDLKVFLPLTILLIALLLWLSFRCWSAVVLPLLSIGLGLVWLLGTMAWLQAHFTILALMLPTLMLAVGCSYLIHVVNQIGIETALTPEASLAERIEKALAFITLPVIVSALTIIAGFLSLAFTRIPAIRTTAIYAALGAAYTMVLALTFVPALLLLLGSRLNHIRIGLSGSLVHWLEATGRWATAHQRLLYVLTAIIAVISAIGVWRIKIDIDYFHSFKPNSEMTVGLEEINRRLAGGVAFDIIVEGSTPGAVEKLQVLQRIAALQQFAESIQQQGQHIDRALSVVDFLKHTNRAFNGNDPKAYALPEDAQILQELLSERDQLKAFLTTDGQSARLLVRSNLSKSSAMAGAIAEIERKGRELLPEFRVFCTGTFVLLNRTSDQIAGEQRLSITLALITIFVMLSLLFGSVRVGFTALVPNLVPVLFFFGFMGWQGIPLNLTTSLVASVVLGLAVDNAVQFVVRFRQVQRTNSDLREAIIESMRLSGRPIIYANVALAATFAIFSLSNFEPIGSFGLLSAVTIIGCLIEDLVLLPSRLTSPIFRIK